MPETAAPGGSLQISGIRLSEELTLARFNGIERESDAVAYLCNSLATRKVSILFLSSTCRGEGLQVDCCVASGMGGIIEASIREDRLLAEHSEIFPAVGLLTIYPHRSDFRVVGRLVEILRQSEVPLLALATSISAVTVVVPYADMQRAAAATAMGFDLPGNRTPLRPDFVVQPVIVPEQ